MFVLEKNWRKKSQQSVKKVDPQYNIDNSPLGNGTSSFGYF